MKAGTVAGAALAGALLLSSGAASAAEAWTGNRKVTSVYPISNGFIFFFVDGASLGTGCDNRMLVPASIGSGYDSMVASILTAFTAGYTVQVCYDDGFTGCTPVVNRLIVSKS